MITPSDVQEIVNTLTDASANGLGTDRGEELFHEALDALEGLLQAAKQGEVEYAAERERADMLQQLISNRVSDLRATLGHIESDAAHILKVRGQRLGN